MFADRAEGGRRLAELLEPLRGQDAVVLGLPRGGVPVAFEVATGLDLPLDVIVVRKLGVPFQPELAMGAIGEGGFRVLDTELVHRAGITAQEVDVVERRERAALESRVARFRRGRERVDLRSRIAVVVDDGVATGSTARVAGEVARHLGAARVVLAVPVAPIEATAGIAGFDQVECVSTPRPFVAVGHHYRDFSPTSDDEVVVLLDTALRRRRATPRPQDPTATRTSRSPSPAVSTVSGSRATSTCRRSRAAWWSSPTGAAAVATARATASWHRSSTRRASARC
jgi:putative phosphoribosyl transferase